MYSTSQKKSTVATLQKSVFTVIEVQCNVNTVQYKSVLRPYDRLRTYLHVAIQVFIVKYMHVHCTRTALFMGRLQTVLGT